YIIVVEPGHRGADSIGGVRSNHDAIAAHIYRGEVASVVALDIAHHLLDLAFGDKGRLDTHRLLHVAREVEHVARAKERLCAALVEDGARVYLRSHLER